MRTHPIYVLEGPDGVGKTTLANALCEKLGAKYVHLTYRFKTKMFTYHQAALEYILTIAQHQPVVLDRWWMSEIAYANVYRGGSKWPLAKYLFEPVALKHCITYIMCLPFDKAAYLDDFNRLKGERTEMYDDSMDKVYEQFHDMWKSYIAHRPLTARYDWKKYPGESIDTFITMIQEIAEDERVGQWEHMLDRQFLNFTGLNYRARYLLVGDRSNAKSRRPTWPFFEYGNSSLWLADTLDYLSIRPYQLMLTNANYDDTDRTKSLVRRAFSEGIQVVGMGNEAHKFLGDIRVSHRAINHPQYYKRFASNKGIDDLRRVLK